MILFLFVFLAFKSIAQWNFFVGGGGNVTISNKKEYLDRYSISYDYPLRHKFKSGVGWFGGFGFSYLLKNHHNFIGQLNFSQHRFTDQYNIPNIYFDDSSNMYSQFSNPNYKEQVYENTLSIPLSYGYSFQLPHSIRITPYLGWNSSFSIGGNSSRILSSRPFYTGLIKAGVRLRYRFLFIDLSYNAALTTSFERIYSYHKQLAFFSFGYTHALKSKEERKKSPKIGVWRIGVGLGGQLSFYLFGLKYQKYNLSLPHGNFPNTLYKTTNTYSPHLYSFVEISLLHQYRRHLFFLPLRIGYEFFKYTSQFIQYDGDFNATSSHENSLSGRSVELQLPICYGFDVVNKNHFSLFPYIGVSNIFHFFSKTMTTNQAYYNVNYDYQNYSEAFYSTAAILGLRFRMKGFYVGVEYKVSIYTRDDFNYMHSVALNLGYSIPLVKKKK